MYLIPSWNVTSHIKSPVDSIKLAYTKPPPSPGFANNNSNVNNPSTFPKSLFVLINSKYKPLATQITFFSTLYALFLYPSISSSVNACTLFVM